MKRILATAAIAWMAVAGSAAQTRPTPVGRVSPKADLSSTAHYRAWLNQYCVGCHNSKTAQPTNDPVNLEAPSLDDLIPHAATWERVLRKLSVRAMQPQGMPHPA